MIENDKSEKRKYGMDLKIIIVGDLSTGKTSILNRFINGTFEQNSRATIAPEFSYKIIKSKDVIFRIQFWDIPGQNRIPELTGIFCRDTQGIIFVSSVKDKNTRDHLKNWEDSLKEFSDIKDIPKILIENKCDLLGDEDHYNDDIESLKKFSEERNCLGCFRTSALNGYNIKKAIDFIINESIKLVEEDEVQYSKVIKMNESMNKTEKNRCC